MNTKLHIGFTALALTLCSIPAWAQAEEQDSLVNIAFGKIDKRDVISAASFVNINEISKKNANNSPLSDVATHVGGYNGSIWGQGPLVLIDGVPRDASLVKASEVESVSILKDATAVALYGSKGAKGVVLITTKRGKEEPMHIDVRANVGAMLPKAYPKYLDAATYMNLYNEACLNDGKSALYDQATIYNTAMGTNPYRYPDMDFYSSEYLRDFVTTADITGEVYGGTEKTKYYLNLGVDYANDLLKYGQHSKSNTFNFNVRGNVDMTIAKWLRATTNAAIIINDNLSGRGSYWSDAASLRPNWFSPWLPVSMMDPNNASIQDYINTSTHLIDGQYLLGGTTSNQTNAYSEALAAGYTRQKYRKFLFDLTLNADLSSVTKGLSFKTAFSVDYNSHYSEAYALPYAVYQPTWGNINGQDMIIGLNKINEDKSSTNEYVGQSTYHQTMMFSAQFDYARSFAEAHNVNATLVGWGFQQHFSADSNHDIEGGEGNGYHRPSNVNAGLRVNYNYMHRYYVDLTGALVHSSKLPEGKRNAFSPAVSIAWNLANENFMESSRNWLDELKIMGSYANLHQDIDINDWYLYKADYQFSPSSGWYQWADGTVGGSTSTSKRGENNELTFITRKEFRVGLDATLFNGLINVNANWFNQTTNGLLTQGASTIYPSFYNSGTGNFLPYINYNKDERTGVDYTVNINKNFGDWDFSLGLVGMYYDCKAKLRDEVWEEDYLYRQGHALGTTWGYVCEGYFQSEAEIASSPKQSFGGTVRPGDLKYKDINGDNVIDSKDQIDLKTNNPYFYGMNLTVKYKDFTLYLSGTGTSGGKFFKNDSYYWLRGTSKFSEVALGRWTPETAETATFPRLTTENGDNNYQNSTYWMADYNYFRLDNLQLTYDFKSLGKCFIKGISVYAGAYNLFTLSKEREYMERSLYGPQFRTIYIGCKLNM
ncbi:MAG: SusC/RagA family TonB-linked outer membrane protein [Muribaculaceae bacterium]|nr:SusC/RagA family TonB-linked outer membrane protein [Muribaculaceae bacterium]